MYHPRYPLYRCVFTQIYRKKSTLLTTLITTLIETLITTLIATNNTFNKTTLIKQI